MGALQSWPAIGLAMALLVLLARLCRMRSLPRLPLRLTLAALVCRGLWLLLPLSRLPAGYRLGLGIVDDLLICFATIRLLTWAALELPGGLGWWRPPPKLLTQVISVGGGALVAVLVVRQTTRFDLINLVATSAVLTAVIGLAAQEGLKDLFSGLELQATEDFRIGDWLELPDGRRGIVASISWRETRLRTVDGCILVVPNSKITSDVFVNRSGLGVCSDRFEVGLSYDFPPGRAIPLLLKVLHQHPLVLAEPAPDVRLFAFLDSSVSYQVQVWQEAPGEKAMLDLRNQLLQQIWYAVRREGQSFPYPVRELMRHHSPDAQAPERLGSPAACAEVLASLPMFADLSPEQRREVIDGSQRLTFGPGETVVREGAEGDSLYCLLRGRVDVIKSMPDRRDVIVRQLHSGDVFGEMTLFLNAPRSATVRTVEECLLLRVDRPALRRLLEQNPALLERIATLVSARQAELNAIASDQQEVNSRGLLDTMRRLFLVVRGGGS